MVTVTVLPDGVEFPARAGETILATIVRDGYSHRFGCRRGGCGICKADLVDGEVIYEATVAESVLTAEERAQGVCLTCRAVPVTDVVVRLADGDRLRCVAPLAFAVARQSSASSQNDSSSERKDQLSWA